LPQFFIIKLLLININPITPIPVCNHLQTYPHPLFKKTGKIPFFNPSKYIMNIGIQAIATAVSGVSNSKIQNILHKLFF
jgi:hypothetical protein